MGVVVDEDVGEGKEDVRMRRVVEDIAWEF